MHVNATWRYNKFEPFILSSQANQVIFIPYSEDQKIWNILVISYKIMSLGRIIEGDDAPLQQYCVYDVHVPDQPTD